MSNTVGVIAEDGSDVEVIRVLIHKIVPTRKFGIKSFVGEGHGRIRGKCFQWAGVLKSRGCSTLILVHDLDEADLAELRRQLDQALRQCAIAKRVVVVPIREIEAWLLSDAAAIQRAMHLETPVPSLATPEDVLDPKKKLGEIVRIRSGRTRIYLNTVHNAKIAAEVDLANLRRCSSFVPLETFVTANIK